MHLLSPQHMKTCKNPPSYKSEVRNRLNILTEADEVQGLREEKSKKLAMMAGEGENGEFGEILKSSIKIQISNFLFTFVKFRLILINFIKLR